MHEQPASEKEMAKIDTNRGRIALIRRALARLRTGETRCSRCAVPATHLHGAGEDIQVFCQAHAKSAALDRRIVRQRAEREQMRRGTSKGAA